MQVDIRTGRDKNNEKGASPKARPFPSIHPIQRGSAWSSPVDGYQVPPLQPPPPVQDLVTVEPALSYVNVLPDFDVASSV